MTYELESALKFIGLTNCKFNERHSRSITSRQVIDKANVCENNTNTGIPTIARRTRPNANLAYTQERSVHGTNNLYT